MPLTPDQMHKAIIRNLPANTGRTLEQWVEVVRREGPNGGQERVTWLKREFKLGTNQAWVIAGKADEPDGDVPETGEEKVMRQYSGTRAGLRSIYEHLKTAAEALGPDVQVDPRQGYVSLMRRRQFAVIQPTTKTRVDLGLALPDVPPSGRLLAAKNVGSVRIVRKVALSSADEVDDEVIGWLRQAYEADERSISL